MNARPDTRALIATTRFGRDVLSRMLFGAPAYIASFMGIGRQRW